MKRVTTKVDQILFKASSWVPNNPSFPVLHYRIREAADDFPGLFAANGWEGIWRNGVFDYQHYHTGAHEVLGVARGTARLLIGGPDGRQFAVEAGDCLLLPAGTGHQNLGCSSDFEVIGAYPPHQHADIQTSKATDEMLAKIASLSVPPSDPVQGVGGSVHEFWR